MAVLLIRHLEKKERFTRSDLWGLFLLSPVLLSNFSSNKHMFISKSRNLECVKNLVIFQLNKTIISERLRGPVQYSFSVTHI